MARKTLTLIIVLLILASGLLYLAFRSNQKDSATIAPPIVSPQPTPTPVAQTVLSLSPNPLVVASQSGSLALNIDTGANLVTAVQVELSYDPNIFAVTDIVAGTFFDDPITLLKKIDAANGKASYVLATSPAAKAQKGKGIIATLSFTTTIASGQKTQVSFTKKTLVTAEGAQESVLKATEAATIFYVQQAGTGQTPIGPVKPTTQSAQTTP